MNKGKGATMRNKGLYIGLTTVLIVGALAFVLASSGKDNDTDTPANATQEHSQQVSESTQAEESTSSEAEATNEVTIQNFAFTPATIKVKVGDTVTWTNQDSTQHDVIADTPSDDAPKGPLLAKGETYKFTFKKAGTYSYHCGPHPQMQATVIVE